MGINREALKRVIEGTPTERVYLCSKDFSLFFTYYYCDYIKYAYADFHYDFFQDIHDLINGDIREALWLAFRESAKTSIAKGFITWLILYKKRNYLNVDSFDKENAERVLFDIVIELQTNPRIKADFGEMYNAKRDANETTQKRVGNFITNNGVRVEAHSTGESVRGRIHGHQRPDFLLLDDFENNKTKDSKAHTEQVIAHINEFKGGLDSTAIVLYLGNYLTEYGSIQTLIERSKIDKGIRVRNVPVMINNKPTWEAKYALTDIEAKETGKISLEDKKRMLGSLVFAAEMMNQPIDESTSVFKKEWFKSKPLNACENMTIRKFVMMDTALSKTKGSDYTGISRVYVDEQNRWYIDAQRYQINAKGLIDFIFKFHDEGFEKIGIEQTAFVDAIEPFYLEECAKRNKYPYVVPLKHGGVQKETRIQGLVPRYEAGQMFHFEGKCLDLETEALRFPKGQHDDVIDSLAYGLQICEPPFKTTYIEEKESLLYPDIGI